MKINKRAKLVYAVGINDAEYKTNNYIEGKRVRCPLYVKWSSMLYRCYCKSYKDSHPTYKDCTVCEQWLTFSNFKAWMQTQDWEGKELDKDILFRGNKVYGPDTCVFVSKAVNNFLIESNSIRGEQPIGVYWDSSSGRYKAQCQSVETGKQKTLGHYLTAKEAHKAWLTFKLEQAYILAEQQTDQRVAKALIDRYENYTVGPQPA